MSPAFGEKRGYVNDRIGNGTVGGRAELHIPVRRLAGKHNEVNIFGNCSAPRDGQKYQFP